MIVIVDYGLGNLGSIKNMLKKIGFDSVISSDLKDIETASKLILPGVGSFDQGMKNLNEGGFIPVLEKKVLQEKTPILGICLGMQLMTKGSGEGTLPGLGWVDATTVKFDSGNQPKKYSIPHMGWEYVHATKSSALVPNLAEKSKFYFVHSFYVKCSNPSDVVLKSNYIHEFDSAFQVDSILGVQFHPEKSHRYGMNLLTNFANNF